MPNWKRVIVSGSDAALNSLEITTHLTASGLIYPTTDGTENQSIITDGAGNLSFGNPSAGFVQIAVKNVSGGLLTKGTPVFITGSVGASTTVEIDAADASDASKMPAVGVLSSDLAINGEGFATTAGFLKNITTDPIDGTTPDPNDTIYVKAGGGLTLTKPTGDTNLIQNIGKVGKVSAANGGSIVVSSIMRSNDIPNLPEGKIWVGGTNYTVTSSIVDIDETAEVFKVAGDAEITGSLIISGSSADLTVTGDINVGPNNAEVKANGDDLELKTDFGNNYVNIVTNGGNNLVAKIGVGTWMKYGFYTGMSSIPSSTILNTHRVVIQGSGATSATTALLVEDSAGTDLLKVEDGGNVGIGTSTPAEKLTVEGNISGSGNVNIVGDVTASAFVGDGSALTGITAEWDGSHNGDAEITGSLIVSGSGVDLTVEGDVNITDGNRLNIKSAGGTYTGYIEKDSYNATVNLGLTTTFTGARKIYIDDGTNKRWEFGGNSTASTDNIIAPGGSYSGSSIYAGHLGSIGFFSIGSTLAADVMQLFDRTDNNNHGVKLIYKSGGSYSDGLMLDNTGNVGIGTTSPSRKLSVYQGASSLVADFRSASGNESFISLSNNGSTADQVRIGSSSGNLTLSTNYVERLRVGSTGNVGIGTTSPSAKLHISGSSTGDTVLIENNEGSSDAAPVVTLYRNSATPADGDYLGQLKFKGENDTGGEIVYAKITGKTSDVTNGTEDGLIETAVKKDGANVIVARQTGDALKLINGTGLEVDGTTTLGDLNLTDITVSGTASIAYIDVQFVSSSIIYSSGSNIFGDADDDIQTLNGDMVVNDTDLFVDASTSRVGITTNTPAHTLDVDSGDIRVSQNGKFLLNNSNVGMYRSSNDLMLGGFGAIRFLSSATAMPSQTERMIIDGSTGNVGIGNSTPGEKLTISGNIRLNNNGNQLRDYNSNNIISNASNVISIGSGATTSVNVPTGNVGIGTTSPSYKLHVSGTIYSATDGIDGGQIRLENTGGGSTWYWSARTTGLNLGELTVADGQMFIENGGNVGLGTTNPETALHINRDNTSTSRMFMIDQDGTGDASMSFRLQGAEEYAVGIDNSDGNKFKISNSSGVGTNDLLTINTSGNVGIGTSSPSEKLDVAGSIVVSTGQSLKWGVGATRITGLDGSYIALHPNNSETARFLANGNVLIGTTTDNGYRLNVSGTANITGDLTVANANISNQENTDVDTGTEVVATLEIATYTAGFFDFVIKKGTNVRSGTIYACHDGTDVVHTETTTIDLGDTSDVELTIDISGGDMRLIATVLSNDWSIKSLVRGL